VTIFIAWAVFFVIAFLMNYLTASLRKTREALRAAEKELLDPGAPVRGGPGLGQPGPRDPQPPGGHLRLRPGPQKGAAPRPGQRELMDIVLRESQRVSHSLEQFLDFALPAKQVFSVINLPEIMDETLKILKAGGVMNGKVEVAGNFRDASVPFHGNAGQFKQVFWNLVKNALAAMPDGGRLTVDFEPRAGRRSGSGWPTPAGG
jgi:signal transduction histidine kinase